MASHQKNIVAGTSSCFPRSLHFLALLVNMLDIIPIGQGIILEIIYSLSVWNSSREDLETDSRKPQCQPHNFQPNPKPK